MRATLEHPDGTIRNKITVYLTSKDCDLIKEMNEKEGMAYCFGYAALVIVKKEVESEGL